MNSSYDDLVFEDEKKNALKVFQKKLTSLAKAIKNAQEQYERSKNFEQVHHLAELVKANFHRLQKGMHEIVVMDWEKDNEEVRIPLDPKAAPQEIVQAMFVTSQKLKRAKAPLEALLAKFEREVHFWQDGLQKIEAAPDLEQLNALKNNYTIFQAKTASKSSGIKNTEKALPYHLFISESGLKIIAGKNATSNDLVTFQVANGNDLWLHAHGMSGSHVVVHKKKGQDVDPETLYDALQIALYFSKARQSQGVFEVLVSEQKYVSRIARMPKGKVRVSKHKIMTIALDKARIEKIKARNNKHI